jgi:hypothetical protein
MRHVKATFEEFIEPNLIKPNQEAGWQIDTFVHTWFDQKEVGTKYMAASGIVASGDTPGDVIQHVYESYNPTKMLIEHQVDFDEKDYNNNKARLIIVKYSLSKCYSMHQTSLLKQQYEKEQGFKYDACVLLRFDLAFKAPVKLDAFDLTAYNCSKLGFTRGEGVDVTNAIMNSEVFDKTCTLYDTIDVPYKNGTQFCDERLMHRHLERLEVPIIRDAGLNRYFLKRT